MCSTETWADFDDWGCCYVGGEEHFGGLVNYGGHDERDEKNDLKGVDKEAITSQFLQRTPF